MRGCGPGRRTRVTDRRVAPAWVLVLWLAWACAASAHAADDAAQPPICTSKDKEGRLLRKWYAEGTAAGNAGDFYENRDRGHTKPNWSDLPQVRNFADTLDHPAPGGNYGLRTLVLPPVVIGNSSTSHHPLRGGSNARQCYSSAHGVDNLYRQYVGGNLYVYPEHLDHDPRHTGSSGYGDLFPTNTPYVIVSQGSSGSDVAFVKAVAYTLAAFRPEVKKALIENGLLMPTVQMILRRTNKTLDRSPEYLTGKAHPTAFDRENLDRLKMVELAHEIQLTNIPPVVRLKVQKQEEPKDGVDYFELGRSEKLADTPSAIARVFRGRQYRRKMVVSAEETFDLNKRPLTFHWVVLRGDADRITITKLNDAGTVAEIDVPYHERRPVAEGARLDSNRVDIGVFADNGAYCSAPAFVTYCFLDNEIRTYDAEGRVLEIKYGASSTSIVVKDWPALFRLLDTNAGPARALASQFDNKELAAVRRAGAAYEKANAAVAAAQRALSQAGPKEKRAASQALARAKQIASTLLDRNLSGVRRSTRACVSAALSRLMHNARMYVANRNSIDKLYEAADKAGKDAFDRALRDLTRGGLLLQKGDSLELNPLRHGLAPAMERLSRYEQVLISRLNLTILTQLMFPGILSGAYGANYVDQKLAFQKSWRDIYQYDADGNLLGWTRVDGGRNTTFNRDGFILLDTDEQGRCAKAQTVKYGIKRQEGGRSTVQLVYEPGDEIVYYEYGGVDDWQGRVVRREPVQ